jgi:hypothetical protein
MTGRFNTGYGAFHMGGRNGKLVGAHRYAYALLVGPVPPGTMVDHRCRNCACVNPAHLRLATNAQNQQNQNRVRGVHWHKLNNGWQVSVMHNGKRYFGGRTFKNYDDAVATARELRNKLFTHNDADRRLCGELVLK